VLVFGRGAVGVDQQVHVAVVRSLERYARIDVDEPTCRHVVALRRLAEAV
jgi:hypothetical protein